MYFRTSRRTAVGGVGGGGGGGGRVEEVEGGVGRMFSGSPANCEAQHSASSCCVLSARIKVLFS